MGHRGSQTHLSMHAYRGKINRDNMKKHSAMLFFLPMRSTATMTIKSPAANMQKQLCQTGKVSLRFRACGRGDEHKRVPTRLIRPNLH